MLIEKTFLVLCSAPPCHDGSSTTDNAGEAAQGERDVLLAKPCVDGEIVYSLLGLFDEGVAIDFPSEGFYTTIHFLQGLIEGHCANGDGTITDDPLAGFVNVLTSG